MKFGKEEKIFITKIGAAVGSALIAISGFVFHKFEEFSRMKQDIVMMKQEIHSLQKCCEVVDSLKANNQDIYTKLQNRKDAIITLQDRLYDVQKEFFFKSKCK